MYFSSTKYTGDFTKIINVTTDDPNRPKVVLRCRGQILMPMHMTPSRADFGRISRQSPTLYRTIMITAADGGPIAPEVAPRGHGGLDAQICEIEPGRRYELVVSLTPPWDRQRIRSVLRIKTGVEDAPEQMVNVHGSIIPRLTALPGRLRVPLGQPNDIERTVRLRWDDGKPANILEVTSTIPQASVRFENGEREQRIVVSLPAGTKRSPGRHKLTIRTDDSEVPTLYVPIDFARPPASRR